MIIVKARLCRRSCHFGQGQAGQWLTVGVNLCAQVYHFRWHLLHFVFAFVPALLLLRCFALDQRGFARKSRKAQRLIEICIRSLFFLVVLIRPQRFRKVWISRSRPLILVDLHALCVEHLVLLSLIILIKFVLVTCPQILTILLSSHLDVDLARWRVRVGRDRLIARQRLALCWVSQRYWRLPLSIVRLPHAHIRRPVHFERDRVVRRLVILVVVFFEWFVH